MKLRMFLIFSIVAMLLSLFALAALADTDIDQHRNCKQCGMDRKAYGYSRMLIMYQDGSQTGVCSLHCAITELDANKGRTAKSILVADRDTRLLIDSETATWVMGGNKRGVMTSRAKWAFSTQETALAFIAKYGGAVVSWEKVLAAAREDAQPKPRR